MFSRRTRIARALVVALVAVSGFAMNGCKDSTPVSPHAAPAPRPEPPPEPAHPTTITGTASLAPGAGGSLVNARAAVYRNIEEFEQNRPVAFVRVTGSDAQIAFAFSELVPGSYYVDVWKDSDNSQHWSPSDFVGWVGNGALGSPTLTPVQVREGESVRIADITMRPIVQPEQAHR